MSSKVRIANRTMIVATVFTVVAIGLSVVVYYHRDKADGIVEEYLSRLAICGNITDENECFANEYCEGIYAPSCPDCTDLQFQHCQRMTLTAEAATKSEKRLCRQSDGEWYENKYGEFCLCGANRVFDRQRGCIESNNNE